MQQQEILPVLYDLSVTIGGEIRLHALLTRTLQRLLYHTSYSSGFVCLDVPRCQAQAGRLQVCINAAVGDFELIERVGQPVKLPCEMVHGCAEQATLQTTLLEELGTRHSHYTSFFRLPLDNDGVIVLLAIEPPQTPFKLDQVLQPVLAQLAKAIVLCRTQDAQQEGARAEQHKLQHSLQRVESQFQTLMELSPIGVGLSCDGTIMDANGAFLKLFGYDNMDALRDQPLTLCIAPEERVRIVELARLRVQGQAPEASYESIGLRRDGSRFPFMVSSKRVITDLGPRTFSYFIDLTEQKAAEQQLRSINAMLRQVLETAPLRIFWKDKDSRYLGCNQSFAQDAGVQSPDQVLGKLDSELGWHAQADLYREDDLRVMKSQVADLNFEEPQTAPDGQQIWLRTSKVPLLGPQGEQLGVLGVYDDITEHKRAQEQIHQLAHFDSLTGLPNRQVLKDALHKAMARSARSQRHSALLLLDLDDFKTFNDTSGPNQGDKLLEEVARRLSKCVREDGMVARPGDDEFNIMLVGLHLQPHEAATQAELVAERVRSALSEPCQLGQVQTQVTASIGIVLFKDAATTVDTLLKHADTAMYQAKNAGRNTIRFFDPKMQSDLEERLALMADLAQAIARDQLQLFFQKQVNALGHTTGAEVLLRWAHPVRGLVSPAQFIPLAEETGAIVPIGLWVVQTACRQLKAWQSHPLLRDLTLAVNVSAKQFHQADFVDQVRRALVQTAAKPSHLKLELTESVVLEQVDDTIVKMGELKLLGLSFSMDDFGTGYSSLQYLKLLPLDQLKIDQGFVRDITTDPNDAAIVQTIIAMTEALGLNVIAEGVETRAQQEFLEQRGCHAYQGYFFGRPVTLAQFETDVCSEAQTAHTGFAMSQFL
jgi:diguanylate cyclase (GGDEF)-like protein/PAS domain S-box-containing protein